MTVQSGRQRAQFSLAALGEFCPDARMMKFRVAVAWACLWISSWSAIRAEDPVEPSDGPKLMKLMPLGASITEGVGSTVPGGYRAPLWQKLHAARINVEMVGTLSNNSNNPILQQHHQMAHEGHSGYRIDQVLHNLGGFEAAGSSNHGYWLTGGHDTGREEIKPDLILIHVGTNDLTQGASVPEVEKRMQDLLDWLAENEPQAKIFVAQLLPIDRPDTADREKEFNTWLGTTLAEDKYGIAWIRLCRHVHTVHRPQRQDPASE